MPSFIFKGCSHIFLRPLSHIFNLSVETNTYPSVFKKSLITPIFKSGSNADVKNYRPICILNTLAKIFEKILQADIMSKCNDSFSINQHGFLPDKSTVTNLCTTTAHAMDTINKKQQLFMTDCAKAFDKIHHGILLSQLGNFGFSYEACLLMQSYLQEWSQTVKIGNYHSNSFLVTSGVPQGSNLGPLLFTIFINDLPSCVKHSESLLFADDFKVSKLIGCLEDCIKLQDDLDSVANWFLDHGMHLNVDKCFVITYTRKINYIKNNYKINNLPLLRKNTCKDLGVNYQTNLKFNDHYQYIVNKAYRALGFIIRNSKHFKNVYTIIRLYNALVRTHLEYASVVWAPGAKSNIDLIEKVQKRFLRYLYRKKYNIYPYLISYKSMLEMFNIQSLEIRRQINSVIFIYYIINNIKYKSCLFINNIHFHVPKINLRIQDFQLFHCDMTNWSPFISMQYKCNALIKKHNSDMYNVDVKKLKSCFDLF